MQNTPAALEHAVKFWGESVCEISPSRRFLAMLALNQKRTEIAADVLPMNTNYTLDMNLRLLLMAELGDWKGVCDLLYEIKSNRLVGKRYRIYTGVVSY